MVELVIILKLIAVGRVVNWKWGAMGGGIKQYSAMGKVRGME